ncbi:MAG: hypothetical protein GKS03_03980 [Alphaproteobacteria bacterium]|nr:hypothetical protein [Alphaproteobacteria bacterium]
MPKPTLVLATSLAPTDERGVQHAAIQSWLDLGISVVAVNVAQEIDALQPSYPDIHFEPASRTAEQHAKRPVPYIYDLLQTAKAHSQSGDTIGIINADIFLRPSNDLVPFLSAEAAGSVILGPRVDVSDKGVFESYQSESEPTFSIGYDYFLMSRDLVDDFKDSPFAMGMPFWDYWLPLTAYLNGRPLKTLESPIALHVTHETRWDDTIYLFFHALIAYAIEQSKTDDDGTDPASRRLAFFLNVISHHYGFVLDNGTAESNSQAPDDNALGALADFYDRFQETAVHTIKSNATTIRLPSA